MNYADMYRAIRDFTPLEYQTNESSISEIGYDEQGSKQNLKHVFTKFCDICETVSRRLCLVARNR